MKELVCVLINVNPLLRYTAKEVLQLDWLDKDEQLKKDMKKLYKAIGYNPDKGQDENKVPIVKPPKVPLFRRKRKLTFSSPGMLAEKRQRI